MGRFAGRKNFTLLAHLALFGAILVVAITSRSAAQDRVSDQRLACERGNQMRAIVKQNNELAILIDRAILISDKQLAPETGALIRDVIQQRALVRSDTDLKPFKCDDIK